MSASAVRIYFAFAALILFGLQIVIAVQLICIGEKLDAVPAGVSRLLQVKP